MTSFLPTQNDVVRVYHPDLANGGEQEAVGKPTLMTVVGTDRVGVPRLGDKKGLCRGKEADGTTDV